MPAKMGDETMTAPTPGPWRVTGDNIRGDSHKDGPGALLFSAGTIFHNYASAAGETLANLNLAAAAPDLLAALEVAYAALEGTTEEQDDAQDLALAALIKARGKNHRYLPSARDVARIIDSVTRCHEEGE